MRKVEHTAERGMVFLFLQIEVVQIPSYLQDPLLLQIAQKKSNRL